VRTIWLASYPKSGNTWFRMLVANLSAKDGEPADINNLAERGAIASAREPFDRLLLVDSGLLTHDEIDCLRPSLYEALARDDHDSDDDPGDFLPVRFVKVHDAYTLTPKGEPLLARGAEGAVVMVRDPRDIAPSLANHLAATIDQAVTFLNDPRAVFSGRRRRQDPQLRQKLLGWSGHIASWLEQRDIPVHLVRYEDMAADTAGVLRRALAFAELPATDEAIERAARLADFTQLRQQEQDKGFREAPHPGHGKIFFRRGEVGGWRDELTAQQVARIESAHAPMMRRLGYELAAVRDAADALTGEAV